MLVLYKVQDNSVLSMEAYRNKGAIVLFTNEQIKEVLKEVEEPYKDYSKIIVNVSSFSMNRIMESIAQGQTNQTKIILIEDTSDDTVKINIKGVTDE